MPVCRLCSAHLTLRGDVEAGETPVSSVCVCWITGRCTLCKNGPVVQEVLRETNREDPDVRCRACAIDLVDPVTHQPDTKAPEGPLLEHLLYELKRDTRQYRCEACEHTFRKTAPENTARGWRFPCPDCGSMDVKLHVVKKPAAGPAKRTKRKK